ncbi:MAG: flagellar biosynthesis regulator FlaF [Pseudomonadota bacterium]
MSLTAYRSAHSAAERPRAAEYRLLAEVTGGLVAAQARATRDPALVAALDANRRLWTALALDCGQEGNRLPDALRAQIISLGLWVSRYASEVARGDGDIDDLIAVNRSVMEGLSA